MCDPVSLAVATFAVGATQAYAKHEGQNALYKSNQVAANLNYAQQRQTIGQQSVQLDQQRSENALDTAITSVRAQGHVAASAADMGMSSGSIVSALNADMFGIGRQDMASLTNDQNKRAQLGTDLYGAAIERNSKIASVSKSTVGDLLLGVASAGVSAAGAYMGAKGKG